MLLTKVVPIHADGVLNQSPILIESPDRNSVFESINLTTEPCQTIERQIRENQFDQALVALSQLEPSLDKTISRWSVLRTGDIHLMLKNLADAKQYYLRVMDTVEGLFGMAMVKVTEGDLQQAEKYLLLIKENSLAQLWLGYLCYQFEDYAAFREYWDSALRLKMDDRERNTFNSFISNINNTIAFIDYTGEIEQFAFRPYFESSVQLLPRFHDLFLANLELLLNWNKLDMAYEFSYVNQSRGILYSQKLLNQIDNQLQDVESLAKIDEIKSVINWYYQRNNQIDPSKKEISKEPRKIVDQIQLNIQPGQNINLTF